MIDIVEIHRNDTVEVRGLGKCIVTDVDYDGKNNPFKRMAYKVQSIKDKGKELWVIPERLLKKDNLKKYPNVINGEIGLWSAYNKNIMMEGNKKVIRIKKSQLKKYIKECINKILKDGLHKN